MGTGGSFLPSSPLWLYVSSPFQATLRIQILFRSLLRFTPSSRPISFFKKINNYIANFCTSLQNSLLKLVKIIESFVKRLFRKKLFLSFYWDQALDLLVSVSYYIAAFTPPTYQPGCLPGVLLPYDMGYLILKRVSRLDAFSVYLNRTPLPCRAAGATTGAQLVRSSRSSRTKDKPSQVSYAHDG